MSDLLLACTTCMTGAEGASAGINTAIFILVGASALALAIIGWCGWRIIRSENGQ